MAGLLWTRTTQQRTGELVIHCPVCQAQNVSAACSTSTEQLLLLMVLPLMPVSRWHWLQCPNCRQALMADLPADDLRPLSPDQIAEHIRHRVSPIKKLLAVLAILLFFMPLLGLMVTIPAALANWWTRAWTRKVSLIALVLSVAVHVVLLAMGTFSSTGRH